jgi:hypothetical protein
LRKWTFSTATSLRIKAASITDGIVGDYLQYILFNDNNSHGEANAMVGAPRFGEGLQLWLKRSPGFNLDKVTAPLLVVEKVPQVCSLCGTCTQDCTLYISQWI